MKLVSVYDLDDIYAKSFLYELLAERRPVESISHKIMPTFENHCDFVECHPYEAWYIIYDDQMPVGVDLAIGACYLTRQGEIGVFLKQRFQHRGYGAEAVKLLMKTLGNRRYLANIAPYNDRSIKMFHDLGFHEIQRTFELDLS